MPPRTVCRPSRGPWSLIDEGDRWSAVATFRAYPNGATMGIGNPAPTGGRRGEVTGWSAGAVRRHKRWLYSVEASQLAGRGDAVTLTLRDTPATSDEWRALLQRLFYGLRDAGFIRWHWVVEWQARGTPHVHMAVYGPEDGPGGWEVVRVWLRLTREAYGAQIGSQHVVPITGPVGWLKYLSKHASRGVRHYQRMGRPVGWDKTGRLWGYGGDWPTLEPVAGHLSTAEYHQVRRMVRNWAIADARSREDWRGVAYLRRMLKCPDRPLSTVRGVSEWVPGDVLVRMALCAGWQGELVEDSAAA
ncbi:MAG: rolling circle replication-associated protein [Azonexus sp.]